MDEAHRVRSKDAKTGIETGMSNEKKKKKSPKSFLHAVVVLTLICLCSGAGLGWLYTASKKKIALNERKVFNETLQKAMGEFEERFAVGDYAEDAEDSEKVFGALRDGKTVYAARGAAQGYQSKVGVIVAVEVDGNKQPVGENPEILRLVALPTQETPGMGEKIHKVEKTTSLWAALGGAKPESAGKRPSFQKQFSGMKLSDLPAPDEQGTGKVDAITGATVTSKAVIEAARQALQKLVERTSETYGSGD